MDIFIIIEKYFLWLIFYSVAGWVYESSMCSIEEKRFVNRGFLNGPYCPIYGWGAIIVILILGRVENPFLLLFLGAIAACTLEYITSFVMEKLFKARWWDYSERKFNINGRVCLIGAVVFGGFSLILIKFVHPYIHKYTDMIPATALHWVASLIFVSFLVDNIITFGGFTGFNTKLNELSLILEHSRDGATEKIKNSYAYTTINSALAAFTKKLNSQQRRMIAAFPKFKHIKHNDILLELRKVIIKKRKEHK